MRGMYIAKSVFSILPHDVIMVIFQHLFSCAQPTELIKACIDAALRNLGITIKKRKQPISFEQFVNYRFGDYSADEHITSLAEFQVQKITIRSTVSIFRSDFEKLKN